ncbi:MAG TPA: CoA transferase [Methylomirabilota bacterium]|nr:CoA transferase [Methylomirabilota bacterium]
MSTDARLALEDLWGRAGCEPAALERVTLTGADPLLPTDFKIGTAASATIAAGALAATELWRLRTGREQSVAVDLRAAVTAFRSERFLRAERYPSLDRRDPIFGFYQAGDGRWIQVHSNMPHHREGALRLLDCEGSRDAVAAVVARWKAADMEDAFATAGLPTGMVRTRAEWHAHPQGAAVGRLPLLEIVKIGDSRPEPPGQGPRALSGLRVLDLTRVIAGPVCGRTLAAYGADVLLVTAPHLPNLEALVIDTGLGKLSTSLDVRQAADAERLRALAHNADVFCQSYRPGALAHLGLAPDALATLRPGIVYVTLSAFGHEGPWRERRGFETIIQSVSGMAHEQGVFAGGERPQHLPAQVVDHGTGYLAAFGALVALARRAREGGSYLVRVSLAQTGRWVDALGRVDGRGTRELTLEGVQDLIAAMETPFGPLRHVVPAARMSETPAYWSRPAVPLGTHPPAWPA